MTQLRRKVGHVRTITHGNAIGFWVRLISPPLFGNNFPPRQWVRAGEEHNARSASIVRCWYWHSLSFMRPDFPVVAPEWVNGIAIARAHFLPTTFWWRGLPLATHLSFNGGKFALFFPVPASARCSSPACPDATIRILRARFPGSKFCRRQTKCGLLGECWAWYRVQFTTPRSEFRISLMAPGLSVCSRASGHPAQPVCSKRSRRRSPGAEVLVASCLKAQKATAMKPPLEPKKFWLGDCKPIHSRVRPPSPHVRSSLTAR